MDTREQAAQAVDRGYRYVVSRDTTTDGEHVYVAGVVELPGCIGQGETFEAAIEDAKLAAVDYIESLLQDGREVPGPGDGVFSWTALILMGAGGTDPVPTIPEHLELVAI